jgi:SAM-dependent methyltransferase
MVIVIGWLFRLNRLKMYVAANISNPLFAPFLILAEVQSGAWVRRGDLHELSLDYIRSTDPWLFGADLLIGSVIVGAVAGILIGVASFVAATARPLPTPIDRVFAAAADRYLDRSITAWEFARAKLRHDPVYRAALTELAAADGTLVDIGCGQGLMLAVLIEARAQSVHQPSLPSPRFERLIGIDTRERVVRLAQRALGDAAEIRHATAPDGLPDICSVALLFDVLHLMPAAAQLELLNGVFARLIPGGVLLVREVDAGAGSGFRAVRIGNRIKAVAVGRWRQTFHFRTAQEWHTLFERAGFLVDARSMGEGTPFANVLFRLLKPASANLAQSAHLHEQSQLA